MNSKKIIINFLWKFCERGLAQMLTLVISLILARMIAPDAYGVVALSTVFISVCQVFIDSGLGVALVQKKEADDLDFSSVFFCNVALCACLYAILFFAAPLIGRIYDNDVLPAVLRVTGLTLVVSGIRSIQHAYVERTLQFKKFFLCTLVATGISGTVGLVMAYNGFGVWSLVTMSLTNTIVGTTVLWCTVKWRPKLQFSFERLKPLVNYGSKVLGSALVTSIYGNSRQMLVGKFYTTSDLAFYNKGNSLPNNVVPTIQASITSVLLPVIAKCQDDLHQVRMLTGKAVAAMCAILWPAMVGLAACADTFVELILSDVWMPAVPYLRLFCIEAALWPISSIYVNSIRAIGRSDIDLKFQTSLRIVGISLLFIMVRYSPFAVALCALTCSVLELIALTLLNVKVLEFRVVDQLKNILPFAGMALVMGGVVLLVGELPMNLMLSLIVQVVTGVIVYLVLVLLLKKDMISDLRMLLGKKEIQ